MICDRLKSSSSIVKDKASHLDEGSWGRCVGSSVQLEAMADSGAEEWHVEERN